MIRTWNSSTLKHAVFLNFFFQNLGRFSRISVNGELGIHLCGCDTHIKNVVHIEHKMGRARRWPFTLADYFPVEKREQIEPCENRRRQNMYSMSDRNGLAPRVLLKWPCLDLLGAMFSATIQCSFFSWSTTKHPLWVYLKPSRLSARGGSKLLHLS